MSKSELFFIEPVKEVIETVLYTACIRDERPCSIIIIGPSGIGKSMMLTRYVSDNLHPTDSITSQGLFDIANRDTKGEKKFLLIPDINPTLSRKPSTVQATVSNLLSVTADGTVRVDDGRGVKECKHEPIGIITAATDDMYNRQAKKWFALGLRRRIIPIFFRYSLETTRKLQALVRDDKIHTTPPLIIKVNLTKMARPALHAELPTQIEMLSMRFAQLLGKLYQMEREIKKWYVREVVPISPQLTLTNLARAHAFRAERAQTNEEDYIFLCRFLDFCDPEHPKEI